jgi:hypothetical protein
MPKHSYRNVSCWVRAQLASESFWGPCAVRRALVDELHSCTLPGTAALLAPLHHCITAAMASAVAPPVKPDAASHHLDTLQSMLNLIFLTSGRFIKEHQAGGGTGRQKQSFIHAIPIATERFHDALDQLENEVSLAQAVLRRDLALLKQDRKKREAAAKQHEVERQRLAAEPTSSAPLKAEVPAVKGEPTTPEVSIEAHDPPLADTPEKPSKREDDPSPALPVTESASAANPPTNDTPAAATANTSQPEPEPVPEIEPQPEPEPETQPDFDFDFEFGDAMDTSGNNNDQGDVMDTSGDMDFSLDEGPSSLLPGLEDFAKSGDGDGDNAGSHDMDIDFSMTDLPDTSADAKPSVEQPATTKPAEQPAAQPAPSQDAQEAKPDDTNAENGDLMGTMAADDLEDLFNMDEYENPESTSFDDAFFNFE